MPQEAGLLQGIGPGLRWAGRIMVINTSVEQIWFSTTNPSCHHLTNEKAVNISRRALGHSWLDWAGMQSQVNLPLQLSQVLLVPTASSLSPLGPWYLSAWPPKSVLHITGFWPKAQCPQGVILLGSGSWERRSLRPQHGPPWKGWLLFSVWSL